MKRTQPSRAACTSPWAALLTALLPALSFMLWSPLRAQTADKPKEEPKAKAQQPLPEADFLEFLGSWDSEDEDWNEFLANHDVREAGRSRPADEAAEAAPKAQTAK